MAGNFHDSEKELVGQGVGNIVSGAFGGAAGAGATVRTGKTSNLAKFLARSRSRYTQCLLPSLLLQSPIYVPKAEAVVGCAVVNVRAGGRTPLSGATHSAVLLFIVAGLGRFAQHIPQACLGGLLLKSGWEVLDLPYLARARQLPAESVFVMVRPPHAQPTDVGDIRLCATLAQHIIICHGLQQLFCRHAPALQQCMHPTAC